MLDCDSFQPFDVLRFPYQFEGDPDRVSKLFIVALNVPQVEVVRCFKPTSQTEYYDADPRRLKGVVEFLPRQIDCFPERTLVEPETYDIGYDYIRSCHRQGEFKYLRRLAGDFREKMNAAATNKPDWRKKNRDYFFGWFK